MVGFLSDNAAIATLLALTLLVLLLLAVVLWAALKSADAAARPSASQPPRQIQLDSLKQSFRRAVELIEAHLASRSERYNLAWTLVLNEDDDGHDLPLVAAGIPSALSTDTTLATTTQGISWNFFDKGVAVQLQSRALGAPDAQGAVDTRVWDEFLGLCRSYRAQRPFDSIVLAVPARLLLRSDPQGRAEVAARARQIHRRLWLAQNRFALRFPVVLVVSGCENIPGFAALSAGLPEPLRRGMLGWSSSHELSAPFQPQWIHAAMDDVVRDLSDACAELCALELPDAASDSYFMAPSEVERLRGGLLVFAEELMRPSAYHEPFIFRGVYLTGDCSALAQLAIAQMASASADGAQAEGLAVFRDPASREPAFLRDVFEKKVFAEAGLVRASSSQRLRRPQVHRVVRWAAVAVPVAWAAGLALAGWRLHGVTTELSGALAQFERGAAAAGGAGKSQGPSTTADRDRVLQALSLMERVDAGELGSRLIPGSWSMFDDLPQRVQQRLERDFSAQSIEPMARTLAARVSQLTGTALDPAAGALISASTCRLPMSWPQRAPDGPPAGLNLEDQPDYAALLQYLAQLDELDQARAALVRLRAGPGPASADDLRLAVRVLLGVTWSGGSPRVASLFRRQGPAPDEASANALAQAASCSFDLAMRAVHQSLFQANALLQSERRLSDQIAAVLAQAPSEGTAEAVANLQALLDLIRAQEALARPGQGAWISQRSVQFGPAHEALLQRVQGNGLLGAGVASAARQQAQEGFAAFVSSWDTTLADGAEVMGVGLSWKDKEGTWSLTGERLALRDGLSALLAQPWMKAEGRRRLPEVPAQAGVAWDRAKLDQAVALADARKRLHAELLPKFPAGIQPEMEAVAQAALADHLVDLLAQAMGFTARGAAAASLPDPERARLARIQALLAELGARRTADAVAAISARDALARLRLLDDAFNEADLFLPLGVRRT